MEPAIDTITQVLQGADLVVGEGGLDTMIAGSGSVIKAVSDLADTHPHLAQAIWEGLDEDEKTAVHGTCRAGRDFARASITCLKLDAQTLQDSPDHSSSLSTVDYGAIFPNVHAVEWQLTGDDPDYVSNTNKLAEQAGSGQRVQYPPSMACLLSAFVRGSPSLLQRVESLNICMYRNDVQEPAEPALAAALMQLIMQCKRLSQLQFGSWARRGRRGMRMAFAPPGSRSKWAHSHGGNKAADLQPLIKEPKGSTLDGLWRMFASNFTLVAMAQLALQSECLVDLEVVGLAELLQDVQPQRFSPAFNLRDVAISNVAADGHLSRTVAALTHVTQLSLQLLKADDGLAGQEAHVFLRHIPVQALTIHGASWNALRDVAKLTDLRQLRLASIGSKRGYGNCIIEPLTEPVALPALEQLRLYFSCEEDQEPFQRKSKIWLSAIHAPNLTELSIDVSCPSIKPVPFALEGIMQLFLNHPKLLNTARSTEADYLARLFRGSFWIGCTGAQLVDVASRLPQLMNAVMVVEDISEEDVVVAVTRAGARLFLLDISGSSKGEHVIAPAEYTRYVLANKVASDRLLHCLAASCPNLASLKLESNGSVTGDGLRSLSVLTKLEELKLTGCVGVTDQALQCLGQGCPNLMHMDLTGCRDLSPEAMSHFIRTRTATITSLSFDCAAWFSFLDAPQVAAEAFDELSEIGWVADLSECSITFFRGD